MKTTKLFLSIALVALATTSSGKITDPEANCDCCPTDGVEIVLERAVDFENWMSEPFAGNALEFEVGLEIWMSEPFEASMDESLTLESWMSEPFKSTLEIESLSIESWMITPFGIKEDRRVEQCMASSWI